MVLPQQAQQPLYDQFNFNLIWADPSQYAVTSARLPVWVCPSAPDQGSRTDPNSVGATNPAGFPAPPNGYGACDYMALSGMRASLWIVNGLPMPPAIAMSKVLPLGGSQAENRWPSAMHTTMETKIAQIKDRT